MPPKKRAAPETDDLDAATTPQERRAIQVRLAQRAFRERRENRIKELEARVEELTTASITGGCANCSSERKKTSDFLQHISALEQRIRQLQNECEVLRQKCPLSKHSSESLNHHHNPHLGSLMHSASARESSPVQQSFPPFFMTQTSNNLQNFQAYPTANLQMPSTSSPQQAFFPSVMPSTSSVTVTNLIQTVPVQQPLSTNSASLLNPTTAASINLLGSTAAERFGGPPQTAFAQTAFQAIPSLISCKWVQVMLDSLVSQSNCNEKETIRNYAFKYLEAKYKMLDECSLDDKARALEVIEAIRDQNRIHMDYMFSYAHTHQTQPCPLPPATNQDRLPNTEYLQQLIFQSIPSLQQHEHLLNELFNLIGATSRSTRREEKVERLLQLVNVRNKILDLCVDGDRIRVLGLFERWRCERNENRAIVNELLQGVMTDNICGLHEC